jgi:hypothetical protein
MVTAIAAEVERSEGVVCVGFPTPVERDVDLAADGALVTLPRLTLESTRPIDSMATLNLAVAQAKSAMVQFRSQRKLDRVHLFIKSPSVFAMVLLYRLSGVALRLN